MRNQLANSTALQKEMRETMIKLSAKSTKAEEEDEIIEFREELEKSQLKLAKLESHIASVEGAVAIHTTQIVGNAQSMGQLTENINSHINETIRKMLDTNNELQFQYVVKHVELSLIHI